MKLLSVNISGPKPLELNNRRINTGIFKGPIREPVTVTRLGLEGDVQVNKKHHGGPDQAVYLYSAEDYAWFSEQLAQDLAAGAFGENLTVSSFGASTLYIGDRFELADVVLEITAPRIPCATFGARMGDPKFVKRFSQAQRPGVYTRVLALGQVQVGDALRYVRGRSDVSVLELFNLFYKKQPTAADLKRALSAPIDERGRRAFEADLAKLAA